MSTLANIFNEIQLKKELEELNDAELLEYEEDGK